MALKSILDKQALERLYTEKNCNVYINLPTVNYLLMGIQLYLRQIRFGGLFPTDLPDTWATFLQCVGVDIDDRWRNTSGSDVDTLSKFTSNTMKDIIRHLLTNVFIPFGIPVGSEKQGGQHERVDSIVTWAVNFSTTLFVDGYVRSMVNHWVNLDISAGDQLGLKLSVVDIIKEKASVNFTLNHYPKATIRKSFIGALDSLLQKNKTTCTIMFLDPCIVNHETTKIINDGISNEFSLILWKIAMAYTRISKVPDTRQVWNHDTENNRGALFEGIFCPAPLRHMLLPRKKLGPTMLICTPADLKDLATSFDAMQVTSKAPSQNSKGIQCSSNAGMRSALQRYRGAALGSSRPSAATKSALGSRAELSYETRSWNSAAAVNSSSSLSGGTLTQQDRVKITECLSEAVDAHRGAVESGKITSHDILLHMHALARNESVPEKTRDIVSFGTWSVPDHNPFHTGFGLDVDMDIGNGVGNTGGGSGVPLSEHDAIALHNKRQIFSRNSVLGGEERNAIMLDTRPIVSGVQESDLGRQKRGVDGTSVDSWLQGADRGMKRYGQMSVDAERRRMSEAVSKVSDETLHNKRQGLGVKSMFRAPTEPAARSEATEASAGPSEKTKGRKGKGASGSSVVQGSVMGEKEATGANLF
jgi:hypothetical protein